MHVAFYAPLKPPGHPVPSGDRRMARQLVAALEAAGHSVEIASQLRTYSPEPHGDALFAEARSEADGIVERWGRRGRPADLWFTYHPYYKAPDALGPAVCRRFGIPYVTAEASYAGKRDRDGWRASQALVADALSLARLNFCFTQEDAGGLAPLVGEDRIVRLMPFIDVPADLPARVPRLRSPLRLVTVAMMRPGVKVRSYRFLAEALALLDRLDWRLTVVGGGPASGEVQAAFAAFPAGRVEFVGEIAPEAVGAKLAAGDLFLWPGFGEAYGLSYLEAQAAGLPVVALATHGVPSVVTSSETGLLVADAEPRPYAEAIARIAGDPGLYRRLSRGASVFVASERSLAAAAATLDRHLAPLVAARRWG